MRLRKRVDPAADPGKHVFISYSRRDGAYVERLREGLAEHGVNAWVDLSDIPVKARWRAEIEDGIRRSDIFLFVVSPDSVASAACGEELDLAVRFGKQIVPLVHREVERAAMPEGLSEHQETDGTNVGRLAEALRSDLDRVHQHTLLLVRAHAWDSAKRRRSALLRGRELRGALGWLAAHTPGEKPEPTALQREYVARGRSAARQRVGTGAMFTAVLVAVSLIVGFAQVEAAHQNRSRELAERSEDVGKEGLDLRLLVAREAAAERPTVEARRALLTALRTQPRQERFVDVLAGIPAHRRQAPLNHLPLAIQPGGRLLAVPLKDGIRLVTLPGGRPAWTLDGLSGTVRFSADGRWLTAVTGTTPRTVQVVRVTDRRVVERLPVPSSTGEAPYVVALSPDGTSVALSAADGKLRIRRLTDSEWSAPLTGHAEFYTSRGGKTANFLTTMAFSPDGRFLASGDMRGEIVVRDARTGRFLKKLATSAPDRNAGSTGSLAFHPRGTYLAAGTSNGTWAAWRAEDWREVRAPRPGEWYNDPVMPGFDPVDTVAFSPDGRVLVTGDHRTGARLWEVGGSWPQLGGRLPIDHLTGTSAVFLDQGNRLLWGVQGTGRLAMWEVHGPGPLGEVVRNSPADAAALAVGGSTRPVAVGGSDGRIVLADGLTVRHELAHRAEEEYLQSLALSRDERTLFSAADDGSVNVWDVATGTRRARWSVAPGTSAVALGDHGRLVAAATYDDEIVVRRVADHKVLVRVDEGKGNVREIAFSPDGSLLAAGTEGGTVVLVDVAEGRVLGTLRGYGDYVRSVAFSPDGNTLAAGSDDGTYAFWSVRDRKRISDRISAHLGNVLSAEFSPDGKLLALGGEEGRILLVDVETRRALGPPLTTDTSPVECKARPCHRVGDLAFTQDGGHLLSATDPAQHIMGIDPETGELTMVVDPATVRQPGTTLWSTDLDTWIRAACTRAARPLTPAEQDRYGIGTPTPCAT